MTAAAEPRVLYLAPYFWPEEIGSGPYCTDLARFLAESGFFVDAVCFRPHYPSADYFAAWAGGERDEERHDGVAISRVPVDAGGAGGGGGFRGRMRNDLRYLGRVVRAALRGRFTGTDVVVAYVPSILTLYAARVVRWRTGARIVAVVHDIESGLANALGIASGGAMLRVMRLAERIGLGFADHVVVLTEGMGEELRDIGCRRPITVLPIWANVGAEVAIDRAARPKIMYSGNFGKKQNLDQLLPLFRGLAEAAAGVDVILRGGGSERDRLEAEIARQGIGNVRFLPLAPADAFMAALQEANIHLVPQAQNVANYALPSKLFSIMAAGRPFVCIAEAGSPLEGLCEASGAGLCLRPGDEDGLLRAVLGLLADPERQDRLGRNGRLFVQRNMDRNTILAAYRRIIVSLQPETERTGRRATEMGLQ